ncbi:MAG: hypothetical protein Q4F79_00545 [Eubacteriales bacterium]|nr:hypothetical protein [Eubacteriales bacterium]
MGKMKAFNETMHKEFDFLEVGSQGLGVVDEFGYKDIFRQDYGTEEYGENDDVQIRLSSVQLDWTAYETFSLKQRIDGGRGFREEDFFFSDDPVPVIVGSEYKDVVAVGDTIVLEYIEPIPMKVIGFFKPGTSIEIDNKAELFDNMIVMPSLSITNDPVGEEDAEFQKIVYSLKNCGYILTKDGDSYTEYKDKIQQIDRDLGVSYSTNPTNLEGNKNLVSVTVYTPFHVVLLCVAIFVLTGIYIFLLGKRNRTMESRPIRTLDAILLAHVATAAIASAGKFLLYRQTYLLFWEDYVAFKQSVYFSMGCSMVLGILTCFGFLAWLRDRKKSKPIS